MLIVTGVKSPQISGVSMPIEEKDIADNDLGIEFLE